MRTDIRNNVNRFLGYPDLYHDARPQPPQVIIDIILQYLKRRPALVVDLGSGTGLSTVIWAPVADAVRGVEPNGDMRREAEERFRGDASLATVSFHNMYSHALTEIGSGTADVVTSSQSFHWMDPGPTLKEVGRVLSRGGIFAAYDCDWPPSCDDEVETAYLSLVEVAEEMISVRQLPDDRVRRWDKEGHLHRMRESEQFRFTREVLFHHQVLWDGPRFLNLALSQGSVQTVLRSRWGDLAKERAQLESCVKTAFKAPRLVHLSYRMRLGMK